MTTYAVAVAIHSLWSVWPVDEGMTVPRTQRRICALCGRAFAIFIPEGTEAPERDRLCPECVRLPEPAKAPGDAAAR